MESSYIVKIALVLLTIVVAFGLIGTLYSPAVRTLLGFSEEIGADNQRLLEYNKQRELNIRTINSINALLFSVNSLAHLDINLRGQEDDFFENQFNDEGERVFGQTVVAYTDSSIETVTLGKDYEKQLANYLINCQFMFEDNGKENTACYELKIREGNLIFDKKKIYDALYRIEEDGMINSPGDCDNLCRDRARWVYGRLNFLDGVIDTNNPIYICESKSYFFFETIYLTRKKTHNSCKETVDEDIDNEETGGNGNFYGMRVKNFFMEQEIGDINLVQKFIHGYKPSILYYEVADKSITKDFEQGLYEWDWDEVILWEAVFFAFDVWPGGGEIVEAVGKNAIKEWFTKIFEKTKIGTSFLEKIKGIKDAFGTLNEMIQEVVHGLRLVPYDTLTNGIIKFMGRESADRLFKQFGHDYFENLLYKTPYFRELFIQLEEKLGKELSQETKDRAILELKKKYSEVLQDELNEILKDTDVFRKEDIKVLEDALNRRVDDIKNSMQGIIPKENLDNIILSDFRTINAGFSKNMVGFYLEGFKRHAILKQRILGKVLNSLPKALEKDLSKEETQQVLKVMLDENYDRLFKDLNARDRLKFFTQYGTDFEKLEKEIFGTLDDTQKDRLNRLAAEFGDDIKIYTDAERHLKSSMRNAGQKKLLIFLTAVWFTNAKMESDSEIFHSVGTNAFGYKNAISTPVVFDDSMRKYWTYEKNSKDYDDYFTYFGNSTGSKLREETKETEIYTTEKFSGTIPELEEFFIALEKDNKQIDVFDQKPERFYLVAPCKADLDIKITHTECFGKPMSAEKASEGMNQLFGKYATYESGIPNPITGEDVDFYDNENVMLYSLDENGEPIKQCYNNAWAKIDSAFDGDIDFFEIPYTPITIAINPVLDRSEVPNYCYAGFDAEEAAIWAILNVGYPLAGTVIAGGLCTIGTAGTATPLCLATGNVIGGIAGGLIYEALEAGYQIGGIGGTKGRLHWPYHTQSYNDRSTIGVVSDVADGFENSKEAET